MNALRNWKHDLFARQIAAGTDPAEAYSIAGFAPHRTNHFRLLREPHIAARIAQLKREREDAARAAQVPIEEVVAELDRRGIERIADIFERNETGALSVRDLQIVPVEVAIALLRYLRAGFGITAAPP